MRELERDKERVGEIRRESWREYRREVERDDERRGKRRRESWRE